MWINNGRYSVGNQGEIFSFTGLIKTWKRKYLWMNY